MNTVKRKIITREIEIGLKKLLLPQEDSPKKYEEIENFIKKKTRWKHLDLKICANCIHFASSGRSEAYEECNMIRQEIDVSDPLEEYGYVNTYPDCYCDFWEYYE